MATKRLTEASGSFSHLHMAVCKPPRYTNPQEAGRTAATLVVVTCGFASYKLRKVHRCMKAFCRVVKVGAVVSKPLNLLAHHWTDSLSPDLTAVGHPYILVPGGRML
ncbi:hypothetical protein TREES_T100016719 [Tupaia chinensis]|uniref:Uncharacterized protein n=1 Tax=Tupaia chinensis TaxID=246437 RepID=L9L6V3_TUPCH|nr:hypothetical protein TREES_T100016719 [Tupaia chinensis]